MRSDAKREIEEMADDIVAKLDRRLRRPLNEMVSFFEWLRRIKFKSSSSERLVAAALSDEMERFEKGMFSDAQVAAISQTISDYRQRIAEMAKSKDAKGEEKCLT
jgi:hypothetical protein